MDSAVWLSLMKRAFLSIDDRLEQVLQLNSCREHWIQAEISLYAYYHDRVEIWTDLPFGANRKADLYTVATPESSAMVAEIKCLGDSSQSKCLDGSWSVRSDIARLREIECDVRLFILVIPHSELQTKVGTRLRDDDWMASTPPLVIELQSALVRIWTI
jgi:hypothetical protein